MSIISLIKYAPKRALAVIAMIATAIIVPAALLAYGPARDPYTWESPADKVVFNSITNNPTHGNEFNFVQVRESTASNETYADSISLTAGKEYVIYIYYHNNAKSSLNASGVGVAHGAYVKAEIPAIVKNGSAGTIANGYVGATNATPTEVWDDISFSNTTGGDIALRYIPGSTTIHNLGPTNGQAMDDKIVTTGAPLGYDSLNGDLKGCNEFAGYATLRVKADQANFTINKQVRKVGETTWNESQTVNAGDNIQYLITYKNTGTTVQNDVVIKDTLPKNVTYVAGTTILKNGTNPTGIKVSDNVVTSNGINIGSYAPNAVAYVMFNAKVADSSALECGTNTMTNLGRVETNNGSKEDTTVITVVKNCDTTKVVYTCDSLGVAKLSNTSNRFTVGYSLTNATFKNVSYVIRNAAGAVVETKTATGNTLDYNQATVGKYSVQATITVTADNKQVTATSESCKANFEVTSTPVEPPVTPNLPYTGPGEDIAAFLGVGSLVTALGYYLSSRRGLLVR